MEKIIKLSSIRLNPDNPRLIKGKKFKSLVDSIKRDPEFLEKRGIVHADGVILGGNQRYLAIKEALRDDTFCSANGLRRGEIPALWVQDATDWPEEKRRRFVIVDNGSWGENDYDKLANLFSDIDLSDLGINIPVDWVKPEVKEESFLSKNFNAGKGEDEKLEEHELMPGKYPVTFILDQKEWEAWETIKAKFKLSDDKAAFLKVIGGKNA